MSVAKTALGPRQRIHLSGEGPGSQGGLYLLHRDKIVLTDLVGFLAQSFSDFEEHNSCLNTG
jgi:hypothetical protein